MKSLLVFLFQRKTFSLLIMLVFVGGGFFSLQNIRQELLPVQQPNKIEITAQYKGASPGEIDESIVAVIENEVRGLKGIKRIESESTEGETKINLVLQDDVDRYRLLDEIKGTVNSIKSLPRNVEKPVVAIPEEREKALSLVIYGDQPLTWIYNTAELIRDDLRTGNGIDGEGLEKVNIAFPVNREITIEVNQRVLRQYGLSIEDIAEKIRESSLDWPGGTLYSQESDIVIRTTALKRWANEYKQVTVGHSSSGVPLRLGDVASIHEGYAESKVECWFNGLPAVQLDIFVGENETPTMVEAIVTEYLEKNAKDNLQGFQSPYLKIRLQLIAAVQHS